MLHDDITQIVYDEGMQIYKLRCNSLAEHHAPVPGALSPGGVVHVHDGTSAVGSL